WVFTEQTFNPEHVNTATSFYKTLSTQNTMPFFGSGFRLDLAKTPAEAWAQGLTSFAPYLILLLAILVIQVIQNRQIQARNPAANSNPTQAMILKVMPFVLPIFAFNFAGALAVYWGVQGLCRIATQSYITKELYGDDGPGVHHVPGKGKGHLTEAEADAKAKKKGPNPQSESAKAKSNGTSTGTKKTSSGKSGGAKSGGAKSGGTKSRSKSGNPRRASTTTSGGIGRRSGDPRTGDDQRKK
ncbi:MAG: YidC/Oxa1 family membrane protein insertase, partial [Microthrixaceae bacterium]|nr:YidC/Oxa1 family membrane protein insertase [Microthrixaceae bacterium]